MRSIFGHLYKLFHLIWEQTELAVATLSSLGTINAKSAVGYDNRGVDNMAPRNWLCSVEIVYIIWEVQIITNGSHSRAPNTEGVNCTLGQVLGYTSVEQDVCLSTVTQSQLLDSASRCLLTSKTVSEPPSIYLRAMGVIGWRIVAPRRNTYL